MKSTLVAAVVAAAVALGARATLVQTVKAQAPACTRGSEQTPGELERRRVAIGLMRAIHTAEAAFMSQNGRFAGFAELAASSKPLPTGALATTVVAAGKQYSVLIRDTADPCGYTVFSDHTGLIYIGAPLQ